MGLATLIQGRAVLIPARVSADPRDVLVSHDRHVDYNGVRGQVEGAY